MVATIHCMVVATTTQLSVTAILWRTPEAALKRATTCSGAAGAMM